MNLLRRLISGRGLPWILFAVALAGAASSALLWNAERPDDARRAELEAEARDFVHALTNFTSSTIDEDIADIRTRAAGQFADEVDTIFSDEAVAAIQEARARSTAEIEAVAVQRMEDTNATVLAVARVTLENASLEEPGTAIVTMQIGFVETDDGWKVESVELLDSGDPGPAPFG